MATAKQWATAYPMFGLWQATQLAQCTGWPAPRHPLPPETAAGAPPILVLGNLHDPATPYQGAVRLAKELGPGVLLTWNGQGHTSYDQGSTCIDSKVDNYLVTGTPPAPNITCAK